MLLNLTELDFDLRKLVVYNYFLFHLLYTSSVKLHLKWNPPVSEVKTTEQKAVLKWKKEFNTTFIVI